MGTHGVHRKGVLPWLLRWACRAGIRNFCPALAALVSLVQNVFFLTAPHIISLHLSLSPRKLGSGSRGRIAYLLICVSGLNRELSSLLSRLMFSLEKYTEFQNTEGTRWEFFKLSEAIFGRRR
jgi:hypothetical protein